MIKVNAHTLNHLSGDANINVIATLHADIIRITVFCYLIPTWLNHKNA